MHKFDEMYAQWPAGGPLQGQSQGGQRQLQVQGAREPGEAMQARRAEAEMIFRRVGITFAVYGAKDEDGAGTERLNGRPWSAGWCSASPR